MTARILIVEDEKEIADTLDYALSSAGMSVSRAVTGAEAQNQWSSSAFDLCILDVGLPDHNGFELLKGLRQSNLSNSDMPVIFLTARSDEIDRIVGLEIGADDYVCKPFSPREMVARVRVILKRVPAVDDQPIAESNDSAFEVDQQRFSISLDQQALPLTRAEFHLLSALLSQPERVFTRRQLIRHVFSDNHPSDDRAIDTHIKTLRAKLKSHKPHRDYIITHRGFGYSITVSNKD